jgi:ATP-dependent DNA helicase PIF1
MAAVNNNKGGVFFLHGYGGTGKTFMWNTLAAALRAKSQIVLPVASSGIASLLLPGGRTAHSKFKIPVPCEDNATCRIEYGDDHAQLLQQTKLIIWDEAPMAHRFCFEALNATLRDIMSKHGNIVHSAINASAIWDQCQVLTLTKNMRLQNSADEREKKETDEFSKWILKVGEGKIAEPNDGIVDIEIPQELLITNFDDPKLAIVNSTYPNLLHNYLNYDFLSSRAILASTIEIVNEINEFVLQLLPGKFIHSK